MAPIFGRFAVLRDSVVKKGKLGHYPTIYMVDTGEYRI